MEQIVLVEHGKSFRQAPDRTDHGLRIGPRYIQRLHALDAAATSVLMRGLLREKLGVVQQTLLLRRRQSLEQLQQSLLRAGCHSLGWQHIGNPIGRNADRHLAVAMLFAVSACEIQEFFHDTHAELLFLVHERERTLERWIQIDGDQGTQAQFFLDRRIGNH